MNPLANIRPMPQAVVQKIADRYDRSDIYKPGVQHVDYMIVDGSKRMAFLYTLRLATVWSAYFNCWRRGALN